MRKKTKRSLIITTFLSSLVLVYIGTTHTLGWFDTKINSPIELIKGQSTSAYFYDGKGTKENPYIITNRRHLYNLAWLQYIGHFNQADETGVITPVYFKIAETTAVEGATTTDAKYTTPADIDCSGLVLPPIGTSQYPFVGVFDGNSSIIRNYTVTDSLKDMTNVPTGIKNNNTYIDDNGKLKHCSIIGTFGVVGLLDDKVKAVDSSNSSTTFTISGGVKSSVSNFYIDQVNIKPTADNTLAGLIVGYANANVSYCGAYRSKIEFTANTSKLDAKVSDEDAFSNVSSYTLIGDYNPTAVTWEDRPGQGQNQGSGGSIDFASLSKRITYILKSKNISTKKYNGSNYYYSSAYNSSLYLSSSSGYEWSYNGSVQSAGFQGNSSTGYTYFPLNIDLSTATITSDISSTNLGSYYTSQDHTNDGEPVLSTNTGYIVGYNTLGNSTPRLFHRRDDGSGYGIKYSIGSLSKGTKLKDETVFNKTNISLFYCTNDGSTYRIEDDDYSSKNFNNPTSTYYKGTKSLQSLNFSEYSKTKEAFIEMLKSGTTSSMLQNGYIGFSYLQFFRTKELTTPISFNSIQLNKNSYDNYQMYPGGINFSINQKGFLMKMILSNQTTSDETNLPTIYSIKRTYNENTQTYECSDPQLIYKIYKKNDGTYTFYTDNDASDIYETDSNYTLVNNLQYMYNNSCFINYAAYYFEIPLPKGDYLITNSTNENKGSSALYLDICANAGEAEEETDFKIEKIDFVYSNNQTATKPTVSLIDSEGYVISDVIFSLNGTSTSQVFYFYRLIESSGESTTYTVYYGKSTTDGLTISKSGSGIATENYSTADWTASA